MVDVKWPEWAIEHDSKPATCRDCQGVVYWCVNANKKKIPIDATGEIHFMTCPNRTPVDRFGEECRRCKSKKFRYNWQLTVTGKRIRATCLQCGQVTFAPAHVEKYRIAADGNPAVADFANIKKDRDAGPAGGLAEEDLMHLGMLLKRFGGECSSRDRIKVDYVKGLVRSRVRVFLKTKTKEKEQ
ncbi:MAG: hypothetical protein V1755_05555 [Chloroflexota bacterium]